MLTCNKNCALWRVTKGLRTRFRTPTESRWFVILSEAKDQCNLLSVPRCKQLHGSFALLRMTSPWVSHLRMLLQPSPIHRNCRAGHVFSSISGEPDDQARDRCRLHPLRCIDAGHIFTIGGSVNRSGQNYVGSDAEL